MSTRSLTTVKSRWPEEEWRTHAQIYRHHDGYLEGHGKWLGEFLNGLAVINGICSDAPPRYANGPGRLASMLVASLQDDGHDPDLMPHDVTECGQEYHYEVAIEFGGEGGDVSVTVYDGPMPAFGGGGDECTNRVFTGTVDEYREFLRSAALA